MARLLNSNVQDDEVGDGTTSMVVWPMELLREVEKLLDMKIHQMMTIAGSKANTIAKLGEDLMKAEEIVGKCRATGIVLKKGWFSSQITVSSSAIAQIILKRIRQQKE
ncbi:T-complex protein 1 subunit beta [Tanacetum coccineum]